MCVSIISAQRVTNSFNILLAFSGSVTDTAFSTGDWLVQSTSNQHPTGFSQTLDTFVTLQFASATASDLQIVYSGNGANGSGDLICTPQTISITNRNVLLGDVTLEYRYEGDVAMEPKQLGGVELL